MIVIVCILEADYLPFTALGSTTDVPKKTLPQADDAISAVIRLPSGFVFDNAPQDTVHVRFFSNT